MRRISTARGISPLLALALILALPAIGEALTYKVAGIKKYMSGPARVVEMQGTYNRSTKQENLVRVRIVALGGNGQFVSSAQGTFDKPSKTWKAAVGDFRLVSFYTEFTIATPAGSYTLKTPIYRW